MIPVRIAKVYKEWHLRWLPIVLLSHIRAYDESPSINSSINPKYKGKRPCLFSDIL